MPLTIIKTNTAAQIAGLLLMSLAVVGCGGGGSSSAGNDAAGSAPELTAAMLGTQEVLAASDYLGQAPYVDADKDLGERQARVCRACHTLDANGMNMLGPNLHDMFGRVAGSVEGFVFSEALRSADFVWTPRALDAWLQAPATFLPGNRMSFPGVPDANRRNALIAYLMLETSTDTAEAP